MKHFSPKHKQWLAAGLIGACGLLLTGVLVLSLGGTQPTPQGRPPQETRIETAGSRLNPQEIWVERMESAHKLLTQKVEAVEKLFQAGAQSVQKIEDKTNQLVEELETLKEEQDAPKKNIKTGKEISDTSNVLSEIPSDSFVREGLPKGIKKIVLQLPPGGKDGAPKATLENTLPAGTFAKGILLGGVDASTATNAPSDPRPVLIRVTNPGTLPRKFKSDLKDCHLLASCYGDLSSERVYMRLEKLTGTERLTGEISETQVAGYVVGEDGKAGVRGIVVDRTGPIVRNSLLGGFFSGIGKFFETQQSSVALPVMPAGGGASSLQQILVKGGGSGASSALEKYADFFIKRAEQLQPVLQVAAGREIDIVFTQGTRFGETSVRKALENARRPARQKALETLDNEEKENTWLPISSGESA